MFVLRTGGCVGFEQMKRGERVIQAIGRGTPAKALRQERGKYYITEDWTTRRREDSEAEVE